MDVPTVVKVCQYDKVNIIQGVSLNVGPAAAAGSELPRSELVTTQNIAVACQQVGSKLLRTLYNAFLSLSMCALIYLRAWI